MAEKLWGHASAGMFGYSHLTGGFAGGQAEYVRVPFADVGPIKIESDLPDEKVLFLSDIFPTAYMGAEMCEIKPGDVVAVWGAGPVGLLAMASAYLLGAEQVIGIDRFEYRLDMARQQTGTMTINYEEVDVQAALLDLTAGRGPDACIDAVGMEAHSDFAPLQLYDRVKQAARLETDRGPALRQAILACRSGGTVSVIGVYGGLMDKFPVGSWMNRSITLRTGQCHVQRYTRPLLDRIESGEIDPSFVITHRMPLEQAPAGVRDLQAQAGRLREGRPERLRPRSLGLRCKVLVYTVSLRVYDLRKHTPIAAAAEGDFMTLTSDQIGSVTSGNVVETDGDKIGGVGEIYLDDQTGEPNWVTAKTGLFGTVGIVRPAVRRLDLRRGPDR